LNFVVEALLLTPCSVVVSTEKLFLGVLLQSFLNFDKGEDLSRKLEEEGR